MPRPNLSFETLAIALAALAAPSCSRAPEAAPPVKAETTAAASAAAPAPPPPAVEPTPSASASATELPHRPKRGGAVGGSGGSASCGAGTCTADMKKK